MSPDAAEEEEGSDCGGESQNFECCCMTDKGRELPDVMERKVGVLYARDYVEEG